MLSPTARLVPVNEGTEEMGSTALLAFTDLSHVSITVWPAARLIAPVAGLHGMKTESAYGEELVRMSQSVTIHCVSVRIRVGHPCEEACTSSLCSRKQWDTGRFLEVNGACLEYMGKSVSMVLAGSVCELHSACQLMLLMM